MKNVEYLGDGLYVSFDGYQICLMANSHTQPTDMVYLDPSVYSNLQKYVSRVAAEQGVHPTMLSRCECGQPAVVDGIQCEACWHKSHSG